MECQVDWVVTKILSVSLSEQTSHQKFELILYAYYTDATTLHPSDYAHNQYLKGQTKDTSIRLRGSSSTLQHANQCMMKEVNHPEDYVAFYIRAISNVV
jgi:hypothetical protein